MPHGSVTASRELTFRFVFSTTSKLTDSSEVKVPNQFKSTHRCLWIGHTLIKGQFTHDSLDSAKNFSTTRGGRVRYAVKHCLETLSIDDGKLIRDGVAWTCSVRRCADACSSNATTRGRRLGFCGLEPLAVIDALDGQI